MVICATIVKIEIKYKICLCAQSHPTLWDSMDCSLPGSSAPGIFQAKIPEWVAISFSRGSSPPRDQTHISCIGRWVLYHWATGEAPKFLIGLDKSLTPLTCWTMTKIHINCSCSFQQPLLPVSRTQSSAKGLASCPLDLLKKGESWGSHNILYTELLKNIASTDNYQLIFLFAIWQ